jgi:hypothetical protein
VAYEETLKSITLDADASVGVYTGVAGTLGAPSNNSGLQYRFVKITGEHTCGLATAATDAIVGVLQNKPQQAGGEATVGIFGISKVEAAGAIAAGGSVASDTVGRAAASGTNVVGYALHSTAVAGELVSVLLRLK